jgi:hypothetical protein
MLAYSRFKRTSVNFLGHLKVFNLIYKEIDLQSVVLTFQFRKIYPLNVISKKMGGIIWAE